MTGPLLVTGGSGLLGSAVRELHPGAVFVTSADGDLRRLDVAKALLEEVRPSKLLHLAGLVGGVKTNAAQNTRFFEDNALINVSVLAAARELRIPRVVSILSSCAFPMFADRATSEDDLQTASSTTAMRGTATPNACWISIRDWWRKKKGWPGRH